MFDTQLPKVTSITSSPAIISTSTPSSRDFVDLTRLAPVTTGETITTNTTTNSNDYSETLYRNEIRKSIKTILNNQFKKPGYYDSQDYYKRKRMIAHGIYLSSSSTSSIGTNAIVAPLDLTTISSISDKKTNNSLLTKKKASTITGSIGSIKYRPYTRRPVIYLDRRASYTNTQTKIQGTKPDEALNKILISKVNSNGEIIEFESRV